MTALNFEQVYDLPFPTLDQKTVTNQHGSEQQYRIYHEVLDILRNTIFDSTVSPADFTYISSVIAIPAGAGSGKTRTLVSIIIALLRLGVSPYQINCLSFTNASANDFQSKIIIESLDFASSDANLASNFHADNINCSTIHKHAIDILKNLEPHVGGVGYYFEDANTSTGTSSYEDEQTKTIKKSVLLSLYSSIYFHHKKDSYGSQLDDALFKYVQLDAKNSQNKNNHRFIVNNLCEQNLLKEAESFIHEESLSDAGLGAFTNIDNTSPDYAVAVATDALLRLANDDSFEQNDKYELIRVPKYLFVDEAQDIDIIQALYIRALALNGTNVVLVGDPRQTLYEFRYALSEWVFENEFLKALFTATQVKTAITKNALTTNYRSRKEILTLAETLSERMVKYANHEKLHDAKYINTINDPLESVKKNQSNIPNTEIEQQSKNLPAVNVLIGETSDKHNWLYGNGSTTRNNNDDKQSTTQSTGLARLQRIKKKNDINKKNSETSKKHLECKSFQLPSRCGGKQQSEISTTFATLYRQCEQGDTVGILFKNNACPEDKNFIKNLIKSENPNAFEDNTVIIDRTGSDRFAPIDNYDFISQSNTIQYSVPFTSLMIASAIHYFFSWDKEVKERLSSVGKKEINWVKPAQTILDVQTLSKFDKATIIAELEPFLDAVLINQKSIFPYTSVAKLSEKKEDLLHVFADFVEAVLCKYGNLFWKKGNENNFKKQQPCRFQGAVSLFAKNSNEPQLRKLTESKYLLKLMWEAVSSTPFQLNDKTKSLLTDLNIQIEWIRIDTTLINYPELMTLERDNFIKQGIPENDVDKCVKQREFIHEQFSKLYHHKTRTFIREVASCIGKIVRDNMNENSNAVLRKAYIDSYMPARNLAKTNTWFKGDVNKKKAYGLFADMMQCVRDIDVQIQPKTKRNITETNAVKQNKIEFSTIHSSKGLEWEHVVLVFPKSSPNDKDTSFKSARDALYVAITRAKKTLTILIDKEKNQRPSATNTCYKVAQQLFHECVNELGFKDREVIFNDLNDEHSDNSENSNKPIVCIETSQSELEHASTCRVHHYISHNRRLSSMNPLAQPSYDFFFHGTLSSICASLIGQRIDIEDDPIVEMADFIKSLSNQNYDEVALYEKLNSNLHSACTAVMQTMVPMYFIVGESKFLSLIDYYATNFLKQIASIMVGSDLFKNLILATLKGNHQILIEKPMRTIESVTDKFNNNIYLPLFGIPDIIISGDEINYIVDYKTIPISKNKDKSVSSDTLQQISAKTVQLMNFYQGMNVQFDAHKFKSEVIYVANLTVLEHENIPQVPADLPMFLKHSAYAVTHQNSAIVLTSRGYNETRFNTTLDDIDKIRYRTENYGYKLDDDLFIARPIKNLSIQNQVSEDVCNSCNSRIHCQKSLAILTNQ